MSNKPKIACSRCGSENTELRSSPAGGPLPIRLAECLLRPVHGRLPGLRSRVPCSGASECFTFEIRETRGVAISKCSDRRMFTCRRVII